MTLNKKQGQHLKYMPYAFTEQGIAMHAIDRPFPNCHLATNVNSQYGWKSGGRFTENATERFLEKFPENTEILAAEPTCTYDELAGRIGISRRAITKQIKNLRETGKLKRIGPDKGGHWEVIEQLDE